MGHLQDTKDRLAAKMREIEAAIADDLGYGPADQWTAEQREEVEEAAEEATENWDMADLDKVSGLAAVTPLQKLLAQFLELQETYLDLRDAGLRG